jgi:phosphinothricin acetyltransferase
MLAALIERCTLAGFKQMVVVIGDSGNDASISLHASLAFHQVGVLHDIGFKHNRWVDTVLMQRALNAISS